MPDRHKIPLKVIIAFLLLLLVFGGLFALGYILIGCLFTGLSGMAASVVSGLAGILLFVVMMWILSLIRARKYKGNPRMAIHTQMLDALEEIARGNFDILLAPGKMGPHTEMIEAINRMARELGDLESMRQDFISNVSHEIQSPLTSIRGFATLLKNDALPAGERLHYAEIIEAESRRLSSLSDNLMKLSALDSEKRPLNPQDFRLDKQLEKIALTLEPQWAAKALSIEADLAKCEYRGDEDLLSQVWMNLIHNAIKFTPEGGGIRVSLTIDENSVAVTVADTGVGIAPEDQRRIFERFYKADKSRDRALGGNGLGLSIVKKITKLHGGDVHLQSEEGKGATFTVSLPLHRVDSLAE
jgi:signal transduction histidine kinase